MTTVYCNNKYCIFQENDQCTRPHIVLHNQGHAKVFWFSCGSYEKRISNKANAADLINARRNHMPLKEWVAIRFVLIWRCGDD